MPRNTREDGVMTMSARATKGFIRTGAMRTRINRFLFIPFLLFFFPTLSNS